jgi:hypothetical protein
VPGNPTGCSYANLPEVSVPFLLTTAPTTARLPLLIREPAAILGGVQAVLAAALTLAAYWWPAQLTLGLQAAVLAVTGAAVGLITGWRVAPSRPALAYGLFQALIPLGVLLGMHLPHGADAAILALVAAALGLFTRAEVTPRAALARPAP